MTTYSNDPLRVRITLDDIWRLTHKAGIDSNFYPSEDQPEDAGAGREGHSGANSSERVPRRVCSSKEKSGDADRIKDSPAEPLHGAGITPYRREVG